MFAVFTRRLKCKCKVVKDYELYFMVAKFELQIFFSLPVDISLRIFFIPNSYTYTVSIRTVRRVTTELIYCDII